METGKRGRTDAQAEIETAREQAVRIADSHQPEPLADEIKGGLERILADAHRAIKGA